MVNKWVNIKDMLNLSFENNLYLLGIWITWLYIFAIFARHQKNHDRTLCI